MPFGMIMLVISLGKVSLAISITGRFFIRGGMLMSVFSPIYPVITAPFFHFLS